MKKKLSLASLAICMAFSLTACNNKEEAASVASTQVQETEAIPSSEDMAIDGSALAGTKWSGNDLTIWSFEKDDSTLNVTYVEGEENLEAVGEYTLSTGEDGSTVLTISVPDLELEFTAELTALNEDTLSFTDLETGNTTSLDSYSEK